MIKLTDEELQGLAMITLDDSNSFAELSEKLNRNKWWDKIIFKHDLKPESKYQIAQENGEFYICEAND
mgnify:CR=1 FL=1